jgi:putative methyltransferase (TIGR04325 family)
MCVRSILKDWLPPALVRTIRGLRSKGIRFEGDFKTWEEAAALCTGYDAELILDKVLEATLKVKRGEAAYERDSVLFHEIQYSWPVAAALMWTAARDNGNLHVLDFGGSLGSSYFQNRKFLAELNKVSWSVVEQVNFVDIGRQKIADEILSFHSAIDSVNTASKPNLVLISSVLQYLNKPFSVINHLAQLQANLIVIDRTPFSVDMIEKIKIQHVPSEIYSASYPCRFFNRDQLIRKMMELNYRVIERFDALDKLSDEAEWQGFIFERVR